MPPPASAAPRPGAQLDLVLERILDVPRDKVWAAWTQPALIKQWFTPAPWQTVDAEVDLRPGGVFRTTMRSPEGKEFPHVGCFLEVVPNERLVWTDALTAGWRPSGNPFVTCVLSLEAQGSKTIYRAHLLHADEATRKKHEEMGFADGWGKATDQLVALIKKGI